MYKKIAAVLSKSWETYYVITIKIRSEVRSRTLIPTRRQKRDGEVISSTTLFGYLAAIVKRAVYNFVPTSSETRTRPVTVNALYR